MTPDLVWSPAAELRVSHRATGAQVPIVSFYALRKLHGSH